MDEVKVPKNISSMLSDLEYLDEFITMRSAELAKRLLKLEHGYRYSFRYKYGK